MNPNEKVIARDRDHLLELIEETFEKEGKNCDLSFIDVSQVTDMHDLFAGEGPILNLDTGEEEERIPFDLGIGNWDVSKATNVEGMFENSAMEKAGKLPA